LATALSSDAATSAETNSLVKNGEASQSSLGHHRYTASKAVDGQWDGVRTGGCEQMTGLRLLGC
jgi:hypothetical protein